MSKEKVLLSSRQCRAARALIGWSQEQLADAAGVSAPTIVNFENGVSRPQPNNLRAIQRALDEAGVLLIDPNGGGPGVRLKRPE